jgi:pyroglutamyl-peptidase
MSEGRTDIVVTGFGPFPRVRVNPTTALARAVTKRLRASGLATEALILETSYAGGLPRLRAHLAASRPRAVLMLGLAARARKIRVELFGRGHASPLHPDASGGTPSAMPATAALPLRTTAGPEAALASLRRRGLRSALSPSAGRYLCDACYASALKHAGSGVPVIFIHVPWLRPAAGSQLKARVASFRPAAGTLAFGLAEIGVDLARRGRRLG